MGLSFREPANLDDSLVVLNTRNAIFPQVTRPLFLLPRFVVASERVGLFSLSGMHPKAAARVI